MRGRPLHVVAHGSALREQIAGAKASRAALDGMIRDWQRERVADRAHARQQAAADWKAEHGSAPSVVAAVARRGGIRLGRDWGKEAREEIPLAARRKTGHTLDDMIAELRYDGWRFRDDSELYAALASRRDPRYYREAALTDAVRRYEAEEPYSRLIEDAQRLRPRRTRRTVA